MAAWIRIAGVERLDTSANGIGAFDKSGQTRALSDSICDRALSVWATWRWIARTLWGTTGLSWGSSFKSRQTEACRPAIYLSTSTVRSASVFGALVASGNALLEGVACHAFGTVANGVSTVELTKGLVSARVRVTGIRGHITSLVGVAVIASWAFARGFVVFDNAFGIAATVARARAFLVNTCLRIVTLTIRFASLLLRALDVSVAGVAWMAFTLVGVIFGNTQRVVSARVFAARVNADSVQTITELLWWAVLVVLTDRNVVFD